MKNLFSTLLGGALVLVAFEGGALFGKHQTTEQWKAREAETIQVYENGLDTLSNLVNEAYGEDAVEVSQRTDGSKLYTIDVSKINHIRAKSSRK